MSNSRSQSNDSAYRGLSLLVLAFLVALFLIVAVVEPREASAGMFFGEYNSRFEQDSIRNQEEIIRLLREQNRILERSR